MFNNILQQVFLALLHMSSMIYSQGFICAVGGGTENFNEWRDKPYGWIVEKSDNGVCIYNVETKEYISSEKMMLLI